MTESAGNRPRAWGLFRWLAGLVALLLLIGLLTVIAVSPVPMRGAEVFGAIANIGHASTLALVTPYTRSGDAKIRAGAALAFRRLSPLASNDFVAEWLAREQDPGVKRELYVTLSKQSHDARLPVGNTVLDHAIRELGAKPGVIARRAIIKLLGEAASTYPAARAALIAQSRIEAAERSGLYTVIAQYLGANDLSAGLAQGAVNP